jgi:hypothetical protein
MIDSFKLGGGGGIITLLECFHGLPACPSDRSGTKTKTKMKNGV